MMNKTFSLSLLSPKGEISFEEVSELYVRTDFGPLGIYPNHTPIVNHISEPGTLRVKTSKKDVFYLIENGAIWVEKDKNRVSIIVDYLLSSEEIDLSKEEALKKEYEEKLASVNEDDKKQKLFLEKMLKRSLASIATRNEAMGVKK